MSTNVLSAPRSPSFAAGSKLLDWPDAADYLATSPRHLRRLVQERRIAHVKIGSKVRFSIAALDEFIAANTRG
jgi:excisionase family DNA binding protein